MVKDGDAYIKATPSDYFRVRYIIEYDHPMVGKQELSWTFSESSFERDIAKARTFGFLKDVQKLQTMGRAQGGSLSNALVLNENGLLNRGGFRFADECVRHKILDFLGDLALTGTSVHGYFEVRKAGHSLHSRFLKALMTRPGYYAVTKQPFIPAQIFPTSPIPTFANPFPHMAKTI